MDIHGWKMNGTKNVIHQWTMCVTINGYPWMEDKWNKKWNTPMDDYRYIDGKS